MKNYCDELRQEIKNSYRAHYAVSEVLTELKNKGYKVNREGITNLLKREGIYEGLTGPNYIRKHKERTKKAMVKKHGVENYGQITGGFANANKIEYKKTTAFSEDYEVYKQQVRIFTARSIKKIDAPDYCEYTGIRFADADKPAKEINPNDPIKRSIDHKVPVLIGFINGVPAEEIGAVDNLAFVIRHINTVKSNTGYKEFMPVAEKLREIYINEGFESN